MVLLWLVPALLANIYAVVTQWHRRSLVYILFMVMGGFIALFNATFMYGFFTDTTMTWHLRLVQQVLSCMILPIVYTYFAAQMGRNWFNGITITLWCLMLGLLVPTGFYSLDLSVPNVDETMLQPMTLHFFLNGEQIFWMRNADTVIMLQAIVIMTRIFLLVQTMHRYRLAMSPHMRYFWFWCAAAIAFIFYTSLFNTEELSHHPLIDIYYIGFSALITGLFVLISLNFDLHPIILKVKEEENGNDDPSTTLRTSPEDDEEEGKIVENMDAFFMQSQLMAEHLRQMMEDKKRYLDTTFTTETAIQELGTNRTYFYRMIKAEFDCSFADLLQYYRMKHAAELLTTTELSIQEIAETCGFSDRSSFSRRFRQIYDMTPSQYRGSGG